MRSERAQRLQRGRKVLSLVKVGPELLQDETRRLRVADKGHAVLRVHEVFQDALADQLEDEWLHDLHRGEVAWCVLVSQVRQRYANVATVLHLQQVEIRMMDDGHSQIKSLAPSALWDRSGASQTVPRASLPLGRAVVRPFLT